MGIIGHSLFDSDGGMRLAVVISVMSPVADQ